MGEAVLRISYSDQTFIFVILVLDVICRIVTLVFIIFVFVSKLFFYFHEEKVGRVNGL